MTTFTNRRCLVVPVLSLLLILGGLLSDLPADTPVYRWDNGELIPGVWLGPEGGLHGMDVSYADLVGADLHGSNMEFCSFMNAHLMNANLSGTGFLSVRLTGANLSGANLTDADFEDANLTDADLSLCDLRGADILPAQISSAASSEDAILPDGRIEGLALDASQRLVVRDHAWPITVESAMSLDPGSALQMVFEDDDWGSTISFQPGIEVSLGGTLELLFADDTNPANLLGTTFDVFDWDVEMPGRFDQIVTDPGVIWDISRLYTTGQLTVVPEPSTFMLLLIALIACAVRLRKPAQM